MSVSAQISFSQDAVTTDPGIALLGVTGDLVTIANGNNAGVVQWMFELVGVPPSSTLTMGVQQVGTIPTFEFTPDVNGGYLWHLVVQDANGFFAEDFRVFQTPEDSGRIIPPYKATDNSMNWFVGPDQNVVGWANAQGDYDREVDALASSSGPSPSQALVRLFKTAVLPLGPTGASDFLLYTASMTPPFPGPDTIIAQVYAKVVGTLIPFSTSSVDVIIGFTPGGNDILLTSTLMSPSLPLGKVIGHNTPSLLNTSGGVIPTSLIIPVTFNTQIWARINITASGFPVSGGAINFYGFGYTLN